MTTMNNEDPADPSVALWNVRKLDQLGALAITIRRLMA